ncbi:MAG: HDIG domain-containing protein, partial [Bacteroidales bacterium]|nr:HDIG domain-containing protein [Bacteroidales bacterium]
QNDSINHSFKPFFRKKDNTQKTVIQNFDIAFKDFWFAQDSTNTQRKQFKVGYTHFVITLIDSLYSIGIIPIHTIENISSEIDTITLIDNNFSDDIPFSQLITSKQAISIFTKQNTQFLNNYPEFKNGVNNFYTHFKVSSLTKPNTYYDKSFSEKQLNTALNNISETFGMVQKGERIISYGEIVSHSKFLIINSLKKEFEEKNNLKNSYLITLGYGVFVFFIFLSVFLFVYQEFKNKTTVPHYLVLSLLLLFFYGSLVIIRMDVLNIYIIPFIVLPIIIRAFYNESISLFIYFLSILLISILVPNSFEFILLNTMAGIVAIFSLRSFTARSHFLKTGLLSFATYSFLYIAMLLIQGKSFDSLLLSQFVWFGINSFLILLSYGLIFIFEHSFGLLSEISLIELSNTNRPLLRQIAEKAPGTFQHSLQVANLAQEAANKINANSLLVRTGALYHDIGKVKNPEYFTENQPEGFNPHSKLSAIESAKVIIKHITNGVLMAKKHRIPPQIIDFIRTHHGTGKTEFFYRTFIKENPDTEVNEMDFSYPGPKPFSQETAILMMADSVEAASRSLGKYSPETINNLVEKIINFQFQNKQFDDSNLTLQDISIIKSTFKIKLQNIYHTRIAYPTVNE